MFKMTFTVKTLIVLLYVHKNQGIWPPAYKINLTQSANFVISEEFGSDDSDDIYDSEDEMIKEKDLKAFGLNTDSKKYFGIHQFVKNRNRKESDDFPQDVKNAKILKETIFDLEDPVPWEAGFVDQNGKFIQPVSTHAFRN